MRCHTRNRFRRHSLEVGLGSLNKLSLFIGVLIGVIHRIHCEIFLFQCKIAALEAEIKSLKAMLDDLSYHSSIVEGERDELARLLKSRDGLREELETEVYELSRRLRETEIRGTDCLKMQIEELEDKLFEKEKE